MNQKTTKVISLEEKITGVKNQPKEDQEVKPRWIRKYPIMQQGQSYHIEPKNEILFSRTRG